MVWIIISRYWLPSQQYLICICQRSSQGLLHLRPLSNYSDNRNIHYIGICFILFIERVNSFDYKACILMQRLELFNGDVKTIKCYLTNNIWVTRTKNAYCEEVPTRLKIFSRQVLYSSPCVFFRLKAGQALWCQNCIKGLVRVWS